MRAPPKCASRSQQGHRLKPSHARPPRPRCRRNFLRPRPFPMTRDGAPPGHRLRAVPLKIVAFLSAWAAAFAWLPTGLVLLALAGWAAWITPSLRHLHRVFQNVKEADLAGEIWS